MKKFILILAIVYISSAAHAEKNFINFEIPAKLFNSPAVSITLADVTALLKGGFKDKLISVNGEPAKVAISLRLTVLKSVRATRTFTSTIFPPTQCYTITSAPSKEGLSVVISAESEMGLIYGLYGLLQEKLGYRFFHPKQTFIPKLSRWPLSDNFIFEAAPLFKKRGFHLHTMHPIELTEQLHNNKSGNGIADIKEYIDWLIRNGQNVMQFWLLRTAEKDWPKYAKEYVDYAKKRGVLTGAVISLSTLQQKAFQMINLLDPMESYKKQIDDNLKWLMQAGFDYIAVDFTMGEYLPDLSTLMPDIKKYLIRKMKDEYGTHVMENTHVIKREKSEIADCSGIIIHSVMFYSLAEEDAPVYGNKNQQFMLEILEANKEKRETWYWPESSYWVTFDTSVPLFLMPYLQSRHDDIMLMASQKIDGHVTFTSGWEWGYWSIDYSIARWSWTFKNNGSEIKTSPVSTLADIFENDSEAILNYANNIQQQYLKGKKLISILTAKTPFEELPWPFNKSFQPEDGYSMTKASIPFIGRKHREAISRKAEMLDSFSSDLYFVVHALKNNAQPTDLLRQKLRQEIINSMEITALRAKHRMHTLLTGAYRNHFFSDSSKYFLENQIETAEKIRRKANYIVTIMEGQYRYPLSLIAREMKGHTAYGFGYLYPVSDLHFWQREEEQVKGSRFDAFFMNIWNFWDTLGLDGLF